jgi:cell division inhibitor SulA
MTGHAPEATIAAIQEYLQEGLAVSLDAIEFVRLGRQSVAVVALELLAHREHKTLVGCCSVGKDRQQAIVLATLSALNRVIGGLPARESSDSS